MPLQPGTTLGSYTVSALIGEGGMGEVYQATDTHLKRQVALKILPEAFATDPDRLARFQREAQVLASLNHPHICTLYDIGSQDGVDFLVMEYLDGETLAQRVEAALIDLTGRLQLIELTPLLSTLSSCWDGKYDQSVSTPLLGCSNAPDVGLRRLWEQRPDPGL